MLYESSVHAKAVELTRGALEMTAAAGSGHPTSAASLAHMITILMYDHMRYDPDRPDARGADRLVLSEGHACPIVYAAGADLGIRIGRNGGRPMTCEDVARLREIDSEVDGHPNPAEGFPFFPAATGSLGQGLSIACGLALASRLEGSDARAFCLIGDGESREGQIWEAVDFLADHRLTAVCPIFNCNAYGQTGRVSKQQSPETIVAKLRAAGLDALVIDGHDPGEIREALREHARAAELPGATPVAIVARTVKGWGARSLQQDNLHGKPVSGAKLDRALSELSESRDRLGGDWAEGVLRLRSPDRSRLSPFGGSETMPSFREALERFGDEGWSERDELATRKAYGVALRALGHANPRVVALDGDVSNSTHAELFFKDADLAERFFECRIAEQHMMSCAVGLWKEGYIPFASTFGKFVARAHDQIEMAIVSRAAIKIVGSHCGVSLAADGPSQMALSDLAFFRSFSEARDRDGNPLCHVLQPADARAAYALTVAMARHDGPCYLRTHRPDVPMIYGEDDVFEPGGHRIVCMGSDLLIVSAGYMVGKAIEASERLREHGLHPTLVDLYSLPFDEAAVVDQVKENNGLVLTVEDNYAGGIGSAIGDVVTRHAVPCRVDQMCVRRPPKSGRSPEDELSYLSLSTDHIVRAGMALVRKDQR